MYALHSLQTASLSKCPFHHEHNALVHRRPEEDEDWDANSNDDNHGTADSHPENMLHFSAAAHDREQGNADTEDFSPVVLLLRLSSGKAGGECFQLSPSARQWSAPGILVILLVIMTACAAVPVRISLAVVSRLAHVLLLVKSRVLQQAAPAPASDLELRRAAGDGRDAPDALWQGHGHGHGHGHHPEECGGAPARETGARKRGSGEKKSSGRRGSGRRAGQEEVPMGRNGGAADGIDVAVAGAAEGCHVRQEEGDQRGWRPSVCVVFWNELARATDGFSEDRRIGSGASGE